MQEVQLTGKSGRAYEFSIYELVDELPRDACCFVLLKGQDDDWEVLRSGSSNDIWLFAQKTANVNTVLQSGATHIGVFVQGMESLLARRFVAKDLSVEDDEG